MHEVSYHIQVEYWPEADTTTYSYTVCGPLILHVRTLDQSAHLLREVEPTFRLCLTASHLYIVVHLLRLLDNFEKVAFKILWSVKTGAVPKYSILP